MITAILDTNIFVRAAIRYPDSPSSRVLDAYYERKFQLIFSPATRDELLNILLLPHIRARLDWSDDELLRFLTSLRHAFAESHRLGIFGQRQEFPISPQGRQS